MGTEEEKKSKKGQNCGEHGTRERGRWSRVSKRTDHKHKFTSHSMISLDSAEIFVLVSISRGRGREDLGSRGCVTVAREREARRSYQMALSITIHPNHTVNTINLNALHLLVFYLILYRYTSYLDTAHSLGGAVLHGDENPGTVLYRSIQWYGLLQYSIVAKQYSSASASLSFFYNGIHKGQGEL